MSIILAKQSSKASPTTAPFSTRGLTSYTSAKLSEITVFAKPISEQFAYAGYKHNLESFLWSTMKGEKVFTGGEEYPIRDDYIPTVPIPLPKVIIRTNLPRDQGAKLESIMSKVGGVKREMKGSPVYEVSSPSFKAAISGLKSIAAENSPFIDHFCNPHSASHAAKIIQCIDLFLRTQTYDYKGHEEEKKNGFYERIEAITPHKIYYPSTDLAALGDRVQKRRRVTTDGKYEEMEVEMVPSTIPDKYDAINHMRSVGGSVAIAKPSPHKASYNFGSPSDVPFKPGFFFPYFEGMNIPDSSFIRDIVGRLFFRCMGSDSVTPKNAWKGFRQEISTYSQTDSGMILAHILAGCDMALSGQARLFLIFDVETYKGFCLLGAQLDVYVANVCVHPLNAEELRAELATVITRQGSALQLATLLDKYTPMGDEPSATNILSSLKYLAHYLEMVEEVEDKDEADVVAMRSLVGKLAFQRHFQSFSPRNITAAIQSVLEPESSEEVPFFIGLKDWSNISNPLYQALARFGSNSFSFIASKGVEVEIPESIAKDQHLVFSPQEVKGRVLVYEKPLKQCVNDFEKVMRKGMIMQDEGERAAGQRAYTFWGKERVQLAEGLLLFRGMPEFRVAADPKAEAAKRKEKGSAIPKEVDLDDIF